MGKLIRMRVQERRLLWLKRLQWRRFLFLLGMLVIGSTYQHLRSPRGLPSLWAAVSSQHPVNLAIRDLPNNEMVMVSRDPAKASSEMEGETLVPEAAVSKEKATPDMTMEDTPKPPGTATISPTVPKSNDRSTAVGIERVKENTPVTPSGVPNHYSPTSSRSRVKNYTPTTPRGGTKHHHPVQARAKVKKYTPSAHGRIVNSSPSTLMTMTRSHEITPRTTVKDSEIMATYKILETSPPKGIVEETTPTIPKGVIGNTRTFLINDIETNILTSPRSTVEKDTMTTPGRVDSNSSTSPWRSMGKNSLTASQGAVFEHTAAISEGQMTISTMTGSSPAETKSSAAAGRVRHPSSRTSAPTTGISLATFWGLAKKPSTAPGTLATPSIRVNPTTHSHHCVVVEPAPAMPTTFSPSLTTALLPEVPSRSPSALPPHWPDLHPKGEYPRDLFSVEERRQGWVVLHIFGMMYVFVALAIVCDEYFVPALGIITHKLQISEDVAGATFMAAGGSAPELFTSLIGVFISHSNVGIGTIVGSAVFNILFVIGTCALFSREILNLTWWPLFRDISFYTLDLMMLILFFLDSLIVWWESLLLLLTYAFYVFTMKWNRKLELWVKDQLSRRPVTKVMALGDFSKEDAAGAESTGETAGEEAGASGEGERGERRGGEAEAEGKGFNEGEGERQAERKGNYGEGEPHAGDGGEAVGGEPEEQEVTAENRGECGSEEKGTDGDGDCEDGESPAEIRGNGAGEGELQAGEDGSTKGEEGETKEQEVKAENQRDAKSEEKGTDGDGEGDGGDSEDEEEEDEEEEEEEENEEPLSLQWPETWQKQAMYVFLLPIVFPLWLTVPDVRRLESRKFFVVTFLGSIMWIAMFSYLMVWWAHQVGETIGISEEIMGLTILAAGTSIPDLITSVIVARKGLGDMAVSSSVGSNIFDITVGLPVPWLLFSLLHGLQPVRVSSNGLFCAIVLLFLMLLFVISSIALCRWRMNKILGFAMFLLYFVFLIISVMLEDRILACPVSV